MKRASTSSTASGDRKSTRLNSKSRQYLVCRLLLEKTNYCFFQNYGGGTGHGSWPVEKSVFTENVGYNWGGNLSGMYGQDRWQPSDGKRKGGFGAFFSHRDYIIVLGSNPQPYHRFFFYIQVHNPALY